MHPGPACHPSRAQLGTPIVLAIEGLCFVGKTTLARALATQREAVVLPDYADLAAPPPWPPRGRADVIAALRHFLRLEQQRALLARQRASRLVVQDRSPLSLIAHEFGMDRLGMPAAPALAAHLFADAAERGLILTCDAVVYLRVPAAVSAARQACRGAVPAHLIDPITQAGIEAASHHYLDVMPSQRRLMLDSTACITELIHAVDRLMADLPHHGQQATPSWRVLISGPVSLNAERIG